MFLLQAETAITKQDQPRKAQALASAGKIIEFLLGLSGADSGPLSECLASVYQYVLAAILKGNAWDDAEAVAAGRAALDDLAGIWRKVFPDTVPGETMADSLSLTL
jgi:flagellin-specific chaperone FliS